MPYDNPDKFVSPEHLLDDIDIEKSKGIVREVLECICNGQVMGERKLSSIIGKANKGVDDAHSIGKRHLFPTLALMEEELNDLSDDVKNSLKSTLKVKPSRTVSGVATVSLLTKPHPCRGDCSFCPNDLRMPKSYLYDEPACMRAERCFFDPYLQVNARMRMLENMGHDISKIEILILGSTWHDYPESYRIWFITQVFSAVNDFGSDESKANVQRIKNLYLKAGFHADQDLLVEEYRKFQDPVTALDMSYSEGYEDTYFGENPIARRWRQIENRQNGDWARLFDEHSRNEDAAHRIVGLSIETRPDAVSPDSLIDLRKLGVTKIQMGIQSTNEKVLERGDRVIEQERIEDAIALARAFGFKLHLHFMANLPGADVESDKRDFSSFIENPAFCPDELKIYPCALIAGTRLMEEYEEGRWLPYSQEELIDVLEHDLSLVKPYTRVTRVIRDFCTDDIVAGNKTVNMRQIVSDKMRKETGCDPVDIRSREVKKAKVDVTRLRLDEIEYETSNTKEMFLQFVDDKEHIAGFLRLGFPDDDYLEKQKGIYSNFPIEAKTAMIREVHVYGNVSSLNDANGNVQHRGLGSRLVKRAIEIAEEKGCSKIRVISSVGTRRYYERFGFKQIDLYQSLEL